jgi:hypothetical protein
MFGAPMLQFQMTAQEGLFLCSQLTGFLVLANRR